MSNYISKFVSFLVIYSISLSAYGKNTPDFLNDPNNRTEILINTYNSQKSIRIPLAKKIILAKYRSN